LNALARLAGIMALTIGCLLWAAAGSHAWWLSRMSTGASEATPTSAEDQASRIATTPPIPAEPPRGIPWGGGEAARLQARRLLSQPDPPPEAVGRLLERSLDERPLYAPTWADRAEWLAASGDIAGATRAIEVARALWPERPDLLQRAAWLQVGIGPAEQAMTALMDYWSIAPQDGVRILGLARSILPDPDALVAAAQQVWERGPYIPLAYIRRILAVAREADDLALADALWERLDPEMRSDETLLFPYLQMLLAAGRSAQADAVWQNVDGPPPGLLNGGFEGPTTPIGPDFRPGWATPGWRWRSVGEGFRIGPDSERVFEGRHSLRLRFSGTHNVALNEPAQIIRVRPGQRYRLSGRWSADALTTRSGVFVELFALDARPAARVQTEPRWGSWDWEPLHLEIQVPETSLLLAVRVRRAPTNAFDQRLSGNLWLDAFDLQPLP
jgi:hypothetical protein